MKRTIINAALLLLGFLGAANLAVGQAIVQCAPGIGCNQLTGPAGTNTGDPAWKAFGKTNANDQAEFAWALTCITPLIGCGTISTGLTLSLTTVPISLGGTNATTATAALNNLLPSQGGVPSGWVLTTNGLNATWQAPSGGGGSPGNFVFVIKGIVPLGTPAIGSGTCAPPVTVTPPSGTYIYTSDVLDWSFNGDVTSATGYAPSASGILTDYGLVAPNALNFKVCNNTSGSITPSQVSLNYYVHRDNGLRVSFVQQAAVWGGTSSPQVSPSFTPFNYGTTDVLVAHAFGTPAGTLSTTGTSGAWTILAQSSDGVGNQYGTLVNTTAAVTAQTMTLTLAGATGLYSRVWEYTAASSVAGSLIQRSNPGTTPGALAGTSLSVPNGGVLFCVCGDINDGGDVFAYNGTTRGSNHPGFETNEVFNNTGATATMSCQFTATVGTGKYDIEQWVLSP